MLDDRRPGPVYFGRLLNLSTRSVRDSSSSPSTPREFDDDEELVLPIGPPHSRLEHLVEHLWLTAFDGSDVQFAKVLEPPGMLDHHLPEATR